MILAIIERIENIKEKQPFNYRYYLSKDYKEIFDKLNILLFPIVTDKNIEKVCEICDGLIITGSSNDIPPHYYNEDPILGKDYSIDEFELDKKAIETFSKANKPILGICGGLQSINVCFGGSLIQKVENHYLNDKLHKVIIKESTFLSDTYNKKCIEVNSFHKQCIKKLASNFIVSAIAEDGTIEAIESGNIIGVQWHPERMKDVEFFNNFVKKFLNHELINYYLN